MPKSGIIFDQHYTDSLLKIALGTKSLENKSVIQTARSLPKKEIFLSLLLHGKAFLTKPYWVRDIDLKRLEPLFDEDLIEWIPEKEYVNAFSTICRYIEKSDLAHDNLSAMYNLPLDLNGQLDQAGCESTYAAELELRLDGMEHAFDAEVIRRKILFFQSALEGKLKHFRCNDISVKKYMETYSPEMILPIIAYGDVLHTSPGEAYQKWIKSEYSFYQNYTHNIDRRIEKISSYDLWDSDIDKHEGQLRDQLKYLSITYDCALSMLAESNFASITGLPLQTTATNGPGTYDESLGREAYQLFKIQFSELKFPVIESLDDVLRLRENKHLNAYREVIFNYSKELRQELECDRTSVINKFRNDMKLATKTMHSLHKWETITNIFFYLSLPLTFIGTLLNIPLSDILILPAAGVAKIVSDREKKSLDWLMLGHPSSNRN